MAVMRRVADEGTESRLRILALFVFVVALLIVGRLFVLQVMHHEFYSLMATKRNEVLKSLVPERGEIFSEENGALYPLVTNKEYYLMYAEPSRIEDPQKVIDVISPLLGMTEEERGPLLERISKKSDPYEPIQHKVTKDVVDQVKAHDFSGIGFLAETHRYYPEKGIGGQVFGFVAAREEERVGQYGLEGYYNDELAGKAGLIRSVRDAVGSIIAVGPRTVEKAQNGDDLVLTIDRNVQYTACQKLKEFYERFSAAGATVVIMEPKGAVLAMCSFPDFDPANYQEAKEIKYFNNPATFTAYEPGSVFKVFTMAAGVDKGVVDPDTKYTDTGEVKIGPYTIRNAADKKYGEQTMTQVLENSINTGVIYVEEKVGKDDFKKYVEKFGFGENTGIDIDSESPGDISSLNKKGEIYGMTASFGQGITATPIQLAVAYAAIANGGVLPKPYVVKEVLKQDGTTVTTQPQEVRRVISEKSATLLTGMMTSVVEKGYDKKAKVDRYYLAGKTGTAQIAAAGGGYGSETIHTFAGYGPATNPRFVIILKLDRPKGIAFASDSLSPLFRQLSEYLIHYYQLPPDY